MGIPIIVGVTGHRALREKDIPELRAKVKKELEELASKCPHSELVMLNAAASGADQLCAEIALELGIRLVCPIPFPVDEYRRDFSEEETAVFDGLIRKADSVSGRCFTMTRLRLRESVRTVPAEMCRQSRMSSWRCANAG